MCPLARDQSTTPLWLARLNRSLRSLALPVLDSSHSGLFSISMEIPLPPLSAPPPQSLDSWYISHPEGRHTLLGMGEAVSLRAQGRDRFSLLHGQYQKLLAQWTQISQGDLPELARAFMGFQFDPDSAEPSEWEGFDNALVCVPALLLEWRGQRCILTFSCLRQTHSKAEQIIDEWLGLLKPLLD